MKTDRDIQHRIEQELLWDTSVDGRYIEVTVNQNVATLHGSVKSCAQRLAAQRVAQRLLGGGSVVVQLVVRSPAPMPDNDEELASAVSLALNWQADLPRDAVRAVVERSCVTLDGEVECASQRDAAEATVSQMRGVADVINRVTVRNHPLESNVHAQIAAALSSRGESTAAAIRVQDRDGVVRLTGTVSGIAEKEEACNAAWTTSGVRWVVEQLDVA
ncbi:BON domain-containing protein [Paraburkholderia sp. BR10872]|uniref:BON domain-containing protein n=1 Tax=Paraburkholderia sp. BR10872 TaxID=3236989 RepID=UPI0034D34627